MIKTLVVGIGNAWRGDDAAGLLVAHALRARELPDVTVVDAAGVDTDLIDLWQDAGRVILMASNFGGTRHPAWYHNLNAHPEVTLYGGGYEGRFRAHEATGAEHERLWGLAKRFSEGYARYEQTTGGRTIPVMVLEPVG